MKRKAVFFDIDGTLVPFDKPIPESTITAIRKLRKNGHLAVISTGRTLPLIMKELFEIGFDGIVAGCGSYVELNGKMVYAEVADVNRIMALSKILVEDGLIPFYESPDGIYYIPETINDEITPAVEYYTKLLGDKFMPVCSGMRVNKIYINLCGHTLDMSHYTEFEEEFNILIHGDIAVEIIPKAHNKATGMEKFNKAAGLEREDTYAIGDSLNDVDMLVYAGTGIVMGNCFEGMQKYADYVTTDINDDGIYNALKHYELI